MADLLAMTLPQVGEEEVEEMTAEDVTVPPSPHPTPPSPTEAPVQFVTCKPASPRHATDANALAAEEAKMRECLYQFHTSRTLHLCAAILATQYMSPQDPPQGPNISIGSRPKKFMGKEPLVFTGDCTKAQQFLTQWELFVKTNFDNPAFTLPYHKALIFLTYIQGEHVNKWVLSTTKWVKGYKAKHGPYDDWIWQAVELGFRNTFTDTLEKECAQQDLQKGFHMEGQDINTYMAKFEKAIREAGY
ncbi:hypothetical protein EDB87DRAFT_1681753 [Lactarius vividus]|nr:hypothetical protein EDB87DRAFT_1681753 [Lactarius vividus]